MTIKDMHFQIRNKLNKLDSSQYRKLPVLSIDMAINEGISTIINSAYFFYLENKSFIELLNPYIKSELLQNFSKEKGSSYSTLPEDYRFYLPSQILLKKENCSYKKLNLLKSQRQDATYTYESFGVDQKWGIYTYGIENNQLVIENYEMSSTDEVLLNYVIQPEYVHCAELMGLNGYLKDGIRYTGRQEPILPEYAHDELIRLTVLILTQGITNLDYNLNKDLLSLSNRNNQVTSK